VSDGIEMETKIQKIVRAFRHGKNIFSCGDNPLYMSHVPARLFESLWMLAQYNTSRKKIKSGFFADNLIAVIGIPKAGTKSLVRGIRVLQDAYCPPPGSWIPAYRPEIGQGRYVMTHTSDLQMEITIDALDGGVMHTHSTPNNRTLLVLETLGCKHTLLLRHPLLRTVNIYCIGLQHLVGDPDPATLPRFILEGVFPILSSVYDSNRNIDEVIYYLIKGGSLEATLVWMATWLHIRDESKSIIVRHEDIVKDPDTTFIEIADFLYKAQPNESILSACRNNYAKDIKQASFTHPRGWPGIPEVALNYISAKNQRLYEDTVSRFIDSGPFGERLLEVYPDILRPQI
jgi:hypothetical protein